MEAVLVDFQKWSRSFRLHWMAVGPKTFRGDHAQNSMPSPLSFDVVVRNWLKPEKVVQGFAPLTTAIFEGPRLRAKDAVRDAVCQTC